MGFTDAKWQITSKSQHNFLTCTGQNHTNYSGSGRSVQSWILQKVPQLIIGQDQPTCNILSKSIDNFLNSFGKTYKRILIQNPENNQKLINSSLGRTQATQQILSKSIRFFWSKQT